MPNQHTYVCEDGQCGECLPCRYVKAEKIIEGCLKALLVGYLPSHTPESIPERIQYYVSECTRLDLANEQLKAENEQLKKWLRK